VNFVNGAEGISDIEGKAARGSGERAGKRASFKFARHAEAFGEGGCLKLSGNKDSVLPELENLRYLRLLAKAFVVSFC
jgi:hypothetical protein